MAMGLDEGRCDDTDEYHSYPGSPESPRELTACSPLVQHDVQLACVSIPRLHGRYADAAAGTTHPRALFQGSTPSSDVVEAETHKETTLDCKDLVGQILGPIQVSLQDFESTPWLLGHVLQTSNRLLIGCWNPRHGCSLRRPRPGSANRASMMENFRLEWRFFLEFLMENFSLIPETCHRIFRDHSSNFIPFSAVELTYIP